MNIVELLTFNNILYVLLMLLEFLYLIFAFLIMRQVKLLNASFNTPHEGMFRLVSRVHFLIALGVFALSILLW